MATATKIITVAEMVDMFDVRHGARAVTIVTDTMPELIAGAPFKVRKVAQTNGMVWFNYGNAVQKVRAADGLAPRTIHPRKWGTRLQNSALVEHKGEYYLEVKVERSLGYTYFDAETGEVLAKDVVTPWLRPKKQTEVIVRDFKLSNVTTITHEGTTYVVAKRTKVPMGN